MVAEMAKRVAGKASKTSKTSKKSPAKAAGSRRRAASAAAAMAADDSGLQQKLRLSQAKSEELQAQCSKLKAEVLTARTRIEALEGRQAEVLNRIDWAIDSLQNVIDDEH